MPDTIVEYFYSVRSSFAYLGAARLNTLVERHGLTIRHHPVDLGLLVGAIGSIKDQDTADRPYAGARVYETSPVRENYTRSEYRRWSKRLGIAINVDPMNHYGSRELPSGAVILAQRRGLDVNALSHAILQALWRDDRDIANSAVIGELLDRLGHDVDRDEFAATALTMPVQDEFRENSKNAIARGVFGSPSYIYKGELFFGQDRLEFLEEAIVGGARSG